jgi:hypothetical protein
MTGPLADVNARPHADLDVALYLQNDQGFTNGGTRNGETFRKVTLGRQLGTMPKLPRLYQRTYLVRNLPVQAARLQSHKHEILPRSHLVKWSYQLQL